MDLREFFTERLPTAVRILVGQPLEPRSISPFALERGATISGDAHSPTGAEIKGGGIIVQPDFALQTTAGGVELMMKPAGMAGGTAGRFRCSCAEQVGGTCSLVSTIDTGTGTATLKCESGKDSPCPQCKFTLVLDPKVHLVIA
jgi:hypothetical protein